MPLTHPIGFQQYWISQELPEPPAHIRNELSALDAGCYIVPLRFRTGPTGRPMGWVSRRPILEPRYGVFRRDEYNRDHFLFVHEGPNGEFLPCDRRIIRQIGSDIARSRTVKEIMAHQQQLQEAREARAMATRQAREQDFHRANKRKVREALENAANGILTTPEGANKRDATIYSYAGQTNRTNNRDVIPLTSAERGWETDE